VLSANAPPGGRAASKSERYAAAYRNEVPRLSSFRREHPAISSVLWRFVTTLYAPFTIVQIFAATGGLATLAQEDPQLFQVVFLRGRSR
jgi:hypothetical protein